MKALVRLIKWLIITAVALVVLAVAGYYGEALYSDAQANKALTERTGHSDWQWQKDRGLGNRRSSDVQWRIDDDNDYVMRRVYDDHEVYAWLIKNEDGEIDLAASAYWPADCEEGTSIETSATDSNGTPFTLRCFKNDWGNVLRASVKWDDVDLDDLPHWSHNFDGFRVNENFDSYEWDFQPAVRHLTLQSAKPTQNPLRA